ncbi:hypothetical protein ACFW04_003248 [Cataglyphis niger]
MEQQVKLGRTRSIGLSNFNEKQIMTIWENAQIKPSNLQVELHAYMQQKSIRELCKKYNIVITGYSPLGSPAAKTHFETKYKYTLEKCHDLLNHPIIQDIAAKHKKTTAQILLRYLLQLDIVIIPKSSSPERIKSNIDLFDFALTENDMKVLNSLDKGANGRIFNFLFFKGVQNHPHYPFKNELL